jgi:hypothetical protein
MLDVYVYVNINFDVDVDIKADDDAIDDENLNAIYM